VSFGGTLESGGAEQGGTLIRDGLDSTRPDETGGLTVARQILMAIVTSQAGTFQTSASRIGRASHYNDI